MSEGRLSKALVAAFLLAALLVVPSTASGQQSPPSEEPPEKPTLSKRLRTIADGDDAASRRSETPSGTRDLSRGRGVDDVSRRADGAPLVHVRVEPGQAGQVVAEMEAIDGVDVTNETSAFLTAFVPADRLREVDDIDGVGAVFESLAPRTRCGDALSEGDSLMKADAARADFSVDGTGVTVGVLSDSYDQDFDAPTSAAQDVASGDLPGVGSPCGSTDPVVVQSTMSDPGAIDEGRAMAQIVHDLAPGATIRAGSAFNGMFDMADQIRQMADAGADVIVDDIGYLASPFFQRGPIGEAVAEVIDEGVTYVSAVGNDRVTLGGRDITSYEAPAFRAAACPYGLPAPYTCHDFVAGSGVDTTWQFTVPDQGGMTLDFQWSEPWFGVETDLDLLMFTPSGQFIDAFSSDEDNIALQVPFELINVPRDDGVFTFEIVVARWGGTGTPRFRWTHLRSDLSASERMTVRSPDTLGGGFAYGQPTVRGAIAVGAAPYFAPTQPELFSSRGPAVNYWNGVGDVSLEDPPPPPATELACPDVIAKPDVTGIDGVPTTFFGQLTDGPLPRFFGTSAAAPHVAAVAALMLEANPALTPDEVRATLARTATPLEAGNSSQWGAGLVNAQLAVDEATNGPRRGKFVPIAPTRVLDTRNGTGYVGAKPGAGDTVDFQVGGIGGVPVDAASVVLTAIATQATDAGFVTAHAADQPLPLAANLNLERKGQDIANQVVVGMSDTGRVALYTQKGTHFVADAVGYYEQVDGPVADGRFVPISPTRVLDTRIDLGAPGPIAADSSIELPIGGHNGVPADATAAVLNVTLTGITGPGYVTVHPADVPTPLASSLNADRAGQTIGAHVVSGLSPSGAIELYASRQTELVGDVVGYYTSGTAPTSEEGLFVPTKPTRLLDTRNGNGWGCGRPGAGTVLTLPLGGRGPLPDTGVDGTTLNLTIVQMVRAGYASLYPAGGPVPSTASVNTDAAGQIRPNLVTSGTSIGGAVNILVNQPTHLVADVGGYFLG